METVWVLSSRSVGTWVSGWSPKGLRPGRGLTSCPHVSDLARAGPVSSLGHSWSRVVTLIILPAQEHQSSGGGVEVPAGSSLLMA